MLFSRLLSQKATHCAVVFLVLNVTLLNFAFNGNLLEALRLLLTTSNQNLKSTSRCESSHHSLHERCGTWQEAYVDRHKAILNGTIAPRYLVSITVEAGFTDRVIGVLTGFLFALLTDRAFQIVTYGLYPRFESAFSSPFINWSRPTDPDTLIDSLKYTYRGQRGYVGDRSYGSNINTSLYWSMYLVNDEKSNEFFTSANLSNYPLGHNSVPTVFMASNRGRIVRIFENPHHRAQLLSMGLRPETALRCLWDFLFVPKPIVYQRIAKQFATLQDMNVLKIAINIRVGDHVFNPDQDKNTSLEFYSNYFQCAEEIESFARLLGQRVVWYLTSDSLRLRQLAKRHYHDKILTDDNSSYIHGDCGHTEEKRYGNCTVTSQSISIQMASGQALAMSMCNYFIVPHHSGFGRLAAWLSGPWHNVYEIRGEKRSCTKNNYDSLEELSRTGTGI